MYNTSFEFEKKKKNKPKDFDTYRKVEVNANVCSNCMKKEKEEGGDETAINETRNNPIFKH